MTELDKLYAARHYPMTFWNYCNMDMLGPAVGRTWADVVKDWTDCGMNLAITPRFNAGQDDPAEMRAVLDACADAGIKAILWDGRCQYWSGGWAKGEAAFRKDVKAAIKDFGDHPALFGFHAGDEPAHEWVDKAYRTSAILKEMAPELSPFMNLGPYSQGVAEWMGQPSYHEYLDRYCVEGRPDFLCFDVYVQMLPEQRGLDDYFACLKMFSDASLAHGLPWWVTLLSVGHYEYRCPSEDDFRWQINTAAAHGAKGIAWFFFYMRDLHDNYRVPPIDEHWERTETYNWLSRQNRTFLNFHAATLAGLKFQRVYHQGEAYGGYPSRMDSSLVKATKAKFPLIVSEFKDDQGRDYFCVVNNSQTLSGQCVITVHGSPKLTRIMWGGGEGAPRTYFDDDNPTNPATMLGAWMAPGQMELYRIEPADEPKAQRITTKAAKGAKAKKTAKKAKK